MAVAAATGIAAATVFASWLNAAIGLTLVYAAAALVGGLIEASGWASAGMYFILGTIVGGGLNFTGLAGVRSALLIAGGALWVLLVAGLTDRQSRRTNQRAALADGINRVVETLVAIGTNVFVDRRGAAVMALDRAQDVIGSRPPTLSDLEGVALAQCMIVALRSGEIISYLAGRNDAAPQDILDALTQMSHDLRHQSARRAVEHLVVLENRDRGGLAAVTASVLTPPLPSSLSPERLRAATRFVVPWRERLRFAVMLAVAVLIATSIARTLDGPHRFWLPLAVAFIARPDLGPIIRRAVARTVGTFFGVGIAALVALAGNTEILLILLSCAMAALVPWASQRSHALTVMFFTPIVFVFIATLGSDQALFWPRIIDTAIGAGIVLVMDLLTWSTAPSLRPSVQVARAREAVDDYLRCGRQEGAIERHRRRRSALRAVTNARAALRVAEAEPRWLGRHDKSLRRELSVLDRDIDRHTVDIVESREI